jgi:primary-amine oxidase
MDMVTTSCTCTSGAGRSDEVRHPLDPLTAAEIRAVVQIIRGDPRYGADFRFETIELLEPEKSVVRQYRSGGRGSIKI